MYFEKLKQNLAHCVRIGTRLNESFILGSPALQKSPAKSSSQSAIEAHLAGMTQPNPVYTNVYSKEQRSNRILSKSILHNISQEYKSCNFFYLKAHPTEGMGLTYIM